MGLPLWEIVDYALSSCIIIIHVVALIFLKRSKYSKKHKNQVLIIISLSICELIGTVLGISYGLFTYFESLVMVEITLCFTGIFITFNFYFIMILLTVDRFLVFYLKLKYLLYFSPSKVWEIILCFALLCLLTIVTFAVLIPLQTITWLQVYDVLYVLYLIYDVGYIFLTAGTCSFIFQVCRRHLKFKKTSQISGKKDRFKILIPTLIIATFILFNIMPNIINASYRHEIKCFDKTVIQVAFIFYRIGWLVDPPIYIFCSSCSDNSKNSRRKNDVSACYIINIRKRWK